MEENGNKEKKIDNESQRIHKIHKTKRQQFESPKDKNEKKNIRNENENNKDTKPKEEEKKKKTKIKTIDSRVLSAPACSRKLSFNTWALMLPLIAAVLSYGIFEQH